MFINDNLIKIPRKKNHKERNKKNYKERNKKKFKC